MKNQCDKCICTSCINQPACAKSCGMCKTLGGYVGFCVDQCRCEQMEFVLRNFKANFSLGGKNG